MTINIENELNKYRDLIGKDNYVVFNQIINSLNTYSLSADGDDLLSYMKIQNRLAELYPELHAQHVLNNERNKPARKAINDAHNRAFSALTDRMYEDHGHRARDEGEN